MNNKLIFTIQNIETNKNKTEFVYQVRTITDLCINMNISRIVVLHGKVLICMTKENSSPGP